MGSAIKHGSFTVKRSYSGPPEKVLAALAQADARCRWLVFADGWPIHEYRPAEPTVTGAVEFSRFSAPGADIVLTNATTWPHVDEGNTLIYVCHMTVESAPLASSRVTISCQPDGGGTHLELTEQGAHVGGNIASPEDGTRALLDEVEKYSGGTTDEDGLGTFPMRQQSIWRWQLDALRFCLRKQDWNSTSLLSRIL